MLKRSTLLHLRFPFSFFLMPVFLFAVSVSPDIHWQRLGLCFLILHFFVYPASNGFNSFYDKDEKSIGGLKNPPPVKKELLFVSLALDGIGLLLAFFIDWHFVILLFVYGLASKAYSHPGIRLKKYPLTGWLTTTFFQGAFTFIMIYLAVNDLSWPDIGEPAILLPALISSVLLGGFYPMTQIYQHEEDKRRGDITLSIRLGIRGTFLFAAALFLIANLLLFVFLNTYFSVDLFLLFQLFNLPLLLFFGWWFYQMLKNEGQVNYTNTMYLNKLSSFFLSAYFVLFYILCH